MNPNEEAQWSSHLPALMSCLAITNGPVCEVGMGNFSTPLLHAVCSSQKRKLVSFEDDVGWMARFIKYASPEHEIILSGMRDPYKMSRRWSVVFIDQSRNFWTRADSFKEFIDNTDYICCHDYHRENEDEMRDLIQGMNYHVTRHQEPPTLVVSRTLPIPSGLLDL